MASSTAGRPPWSANRIADAARWVWRRSVSTAVTLEYRSILVSSGLFDTQFYAAQAGIKPDPERCVRHYLKRGAAAGFSPNRLFDAAAYLSPLPGRCGSADGPFSSFRRVWYLGRSPESRSGELSDTRWIDDARGAGGTAGLPAGTCPGVAAGPAVGMDRQGCRRIRIVPGEFLLSSHCGSHR